MVKNELVDEILRVRRPSRVQTVGEVTKQEQSARSRVHLSPDDHLNFTFPQCSSRGLNRPTPPVATVSRDSHRTGSSLLNSQ
jgi:hypothetical protein